MSASNKNKRLLLHICCAGCGAAVSRELGSEYELTLYFFNPNIDSREEHDRRLKEAQKIAKKHKIALISGEFCHEQWREYIKGYEGESEKGRRCWLCYSFRLSQTAKIASEKKFDYFSTTLSVSPHKDAGKIIAIGKKLSQEFGVEFLARDFKKNDGFKKSVVISRKLGLYRQNYCGCEFSYRK